MTTPPLIVEATVAFLRAHEPFSRMAGRDLAELVPRLRLAYFPVGAAIIDPGAGKATALHIIQRGHVRSTNPATPGEDVVFGPGECFPVASLSANSVNTRSFEAAEDSFCLLLDKPDFEALRAASPPFAEFCTEALASIVQASLAQLRTQFAQRAAEQQSLLQPLTSLIRRAPVHCEEHAPLQTALATMSAAHVGTIAVVDASSRPVGIFTLTDLLDRVVLPGVPLTTPIAGVMTPTPAVLDELAPAQEAMTLMATRGLHQLLVTREGRLVGVVSERDLFAIQRVSMRSMIQTIRLASDLETLQRVARDTGLLTANLIAQGAGAEALTHTIAALNDALTLRVFDLVAPAHELAGIDWCWLSLGSEGRREQTIATDQDNALIFRCDEDEIPATRARLLRFAREVNAALAALGFPLCPGQIMAGNRQWCLEVDEWRAQFAQWIREPTPTALLNANIFFDFRPIAGAPALAERLRDWLLGLTQEARLFLRLMAANAEQAEPPLGMIRTFRTDEGEDAGTLDLKTHGSRIFVDAARLMALGLGVAETNTAQRLRLTGRRMGEDERDIAAAVDAFHFLQMLRLRAQRGELDEPGAERPAARGANRIDPYRLNDVDQRMLKEAFRQARQLQRRVHAAFGQ